MVEFEYWGKVTLEGALQKFIIWIASECHRGDEEEPAFLGNSEFRQFAFLQEEAAENEFFN